MADSMIHSYSGPVAARQAQILTLPPPCLIAGMRCLCRQYNTILQTWCSALQVDFWEGCSECSSTLAINQLIKCI